MNYAIMPGIFRLRVGGNSQAKLGKEFHFVAKFSKFPISIFYSNGVYYVHANTL